MKITASTQKIVVGISLALTAVNALWVVFSPFSGPLLALIFYAVLTFLCWRKNDFRAGVIIGILGLAIHTFEWVFKGIEGLNVFETVFFFANLLLPVPLIYFSIKAYRQFLNKAGKRGKQGLPGSH